MHPRRLRSGLAAGPDSLPLPPRALRPGDGGADPRPCPQAAAADRGDRARRQDRRDLSMIECAGGTAPAVPPARSPHRFTWITCGTGRYSMTPCHGYPCTAFTLAWLTGSMYDIDVECPPSSWSTGVQPN